MIWAIAALFQISAAPLPPAVQCAQAQTTLEMERCLKQELAKEEQHLQDMERRVRGLLPDGSKATFDTAATTWRDYRAEECRTVYEQSAPGSIAAPSLLGCKIELTKARTAILRRIYVPDR